MAHDWKVLLITEELLPQKKGIWILMISQTAAVLRVLGTLLLFIYLLTYLIYSYFETGSHCVSPGWSRTH
jgi:hypothetical protein